MILGAGCELILNLESGLAARCRPALGTSLGSRVVFAQSTAPTARDTFSSVNSHCSTRQNPFVVGKVPVPREDAELSVAGRLLWALSLVP